MTTDQDGRFTRKVDAPVKKRSITLDNLFVRHPSRFLEVGVELELAGRRALYWITLDHVRDGTAGQMVAYVAGPNGKFDRMLKFHKSSHSWTFPDEPDGMHMSEIGAALRHHEMTGSSEAGWKVDLIIKKHEFTVR